MLIASILVCAAITFALRFIPSTLVGKHQQSQKLQDLASLLPAGLMLILVAYTFVEADSGEQSIRLAIAAVAALVVELLTRNIFFAFLLGIVAYSLTSLIL